MRKGYRKMERGKVGETHKREIFREGERWNGREKDRRRERGGVRKKEREEES